MTESTPAKAAADKTRAAYRQTAEEFEEFAKNGQMPEAVRVFAEKNIAQSREFYERSKDAFDRILESWEKTFDAAGQGAVALNRKMVDITQRNINSGFEFAKSLIGAFCLSEAGSGSTGKAMIPATTSPSTGRPRPGRGRRPGRGAGLGAS